MPDYTVNDKAWKQHVKQMRELARTEIAVGVLGESGSHMVNIAIWNHMGTRLHGKQHTPPRPYMDETMVRIENELHRRNSQAILLIQSGMPVRQALNRVGIWVQGEMQQTIADFSDPPNAQSTIKKKGFDNPLIESGGLRQAIAFTVRIR